MSVAEGRPGREGTHRPVSVRPAPSPWWELRLTPGPSADPGLRQAGLGLLLELAVAGVVEDGANLLAYFPSRELAGRAAGAMACYGRATLEAVDESSWSGWRKSFQGLCLGERLRLYPAWEAPPREVLVASGPEGLHTVAVVIEPGLAFGSGEHPTTAACLRYLEQVVRGGERALDLGTGSGVLAIAAALLGASSVLALDLDPQACHAAAENIALNPAAAGRIEVLEADAVCWLDPSRPAARGFDLVTANLSSVLLVALSEGLGVACRPGGLVIASGIGRQNGPEVVASLRAAGLPTVGRTYEGGWLTLVARREG